MDKCLICGAELEEKSSPFMNDNGEPEYVMLVCPTKDCAFVIEKE